MLKQLQVVPVLESPTYKSLEVSLKFRSTFYTNTCHYYKDRYNKIPSHVLHEQLSLLYLYHKIPIHVLPRLLSLSQKSLSR